MTAAQKCEWPGATGQNATIQSADSHDFNAEKHLTTLIAQLAIAGHAVHELADGGFLACKYGLARYCKDFAELQAFARQVGAAL